MNTLTIRRLRRVLRLVPGSTRPDRRRAAACDLPAGRASSAPLDRGCMVPLCVLRFEAARVTEATRQTREMLCGCDEHIRQLEQRGRAAIRGTAEALRYGNFERSGELVGVTGDANTRP